MGSLKAQRGVNVMDSRAVLSMDGRRFYIGMALWPLLESLYSIYVLQASQKYRSSYGQRTVPEPSSRKHGAKP